MGIWDYFLQLFGWMNGEAKAESRHLEDGIDTERRPSSIESTAFRETNRIKIIPTIAACLPGVRVGRFPFLLSS